MTKRIITISREFGSGGRFIGEEVANKLGIKYYDKEIIGQIAKESGLAPEYIKENAHQISETPICPPLTKNEKMHAKGNIIISCLSSEITSDSIPPSSAW
jgi:cytidylate kinase